MRLAICSVFCSVVLSQGLIVSVRNGTKSAPPSKYSSADGLGDVHKADRVKPIRASALKGLIESAQARPRKRLMTDFTKDPEDNLLQNIMNTWTEGSYAPVHKHPDWTETFVPIEGAIAFFSWPGDRDGIKDARCDIVESGGDVRAIIVEKDEWHTMTAAPKRMGYPGHAVVFEVSAHSFKPNGNPGKVLAPFAPTANDGLDGDEQYFVEKLLPLCKSRH